MSEQVNFKNLCKNNSSWQQMYQIAGTQTERSVNILVRSALITFLLHLFFENVSATTSREFVILFIPDYE